MGEYFKGWRRKIGMVTLVMACLFMGGWVRSLYSGDVVHVKTGQLSWICVCVDQTIICGFALDNWQPFPSNWFPLPIRSLDEFIESQIVQETYREAFGIGTGLLNGHNPFRVWILPCRPLAFVTTLLSAFLLLPKPRKSIQKKITEPIPAEGA